MNVAFWSCMPGVSSTSASMLAIALSAAVDRKIQCSVMQLHFADNGLFKYIMDFAKSDSPLMENTGIDALARASRQSIISQEDVIDCTFSFIEKRLNVFTATGIKNERIYQSGIMDVMETMFSGMNDTFKLNLIDVPAGDNLYAKAALALADVVVVCLPQMQWIVDMCLERYSFDDKKVFYVFGRYDAKHSVTIMAESLGKHIKPSLIGAVPYNTDYANAMNSSKVIGFYLGNTNCKSHDPNYGFISRTKETTNKLLKLCGLGKG